ncbi:MAG: adenylyltransferase/cytidyltransferase family protein [Candidatus Methylacidiphilales bacterium]
MARVLPIEHLSSWRMSLPENQRPLVVTNGCFDLLHVGHVRYLNQAAALGNSLLVGINDDAGVRELKGTARPLNKAEDRAEVLAALSCVRAVCIFPGHRAMDFLRTARPDIYAKGGDYTEDSLFPPEREILEQCGSRIELLGLVPGKSTTDLARQILSSSHS